MRTTDLPTGTVTFVFTDIEGSTQLLKRLGKSYGDVVADHRKILRTAVRDHGGEELDTQGDSFLFAFPRADEAAAAAIERGGRRRDRRPALARCTEMAGGKQPSGANGHPHSRADRV